MDFKKRRLNKIHTKRLGKNSFNSFYLDDNIHNIINHDLSKEQGKQYDSVAGSSFFFFLLSAIFLYGLLTLCVNYINGIMFYDVLDDIASILHRSNSMKQDVISTCNNKDMDVFLDKVQLFEFIGVK